VPFITDLDGPEAVTLGSVLARATRVLRDAAGVEKTYVYVFGTALRTCTSTWHPTRTATGSEAARACSIPMRRTPTQQFTAPWPRRQRELSPKARVTVMRRRRG